MHYFVAKPFFDLVDPYLVPEDLSCAILFALF
jgi:hypothetical protein